MVRIFRPSSTNIDRAVLALSLNEVIALPTETVYGLAANATSDEAVAKIFALKNRPSFNPLIVHFSHINDVKNHVNWTPEAERLAHDFWPGSLTMILNKKPSSSLSLFATAGLDTVGVRIPHHPTFHQILTKLGKPLAAPSANPSETISPTSAQDVRKGFGSSTLLKVIDGGSCRGGIESTIIDLTTSIPTILRPGLITKEDLEEKIQMCLHTNFLSGPIKAPGQMKRHYAPHIPLRLNAIEVQPHEALLAFGPSPLSGGAKTLNLSPSSNLQEAAINLYAMMHALDSPSYSGIAVMPLPQNGIGYAINDRLQRAAHTEK